MRHFGKRAFALLLALMLCLSLFPSALAEDAPEEGTINPVDEGSIRPAEEGDALPRTDETQGGETSGQCGENLTWSFDEATGTLTITGSGDMWDWSSGSAPWYSLRASIQSVELPRGLTSIGDYAFFFCGGLSSVDIPAGITGIGERAFSGCSGLTKVTIPDGVTSIGSFAFFSCTGLASITFPASAAEIDTYVISRCQNLKDIYYSGTIDAWGKINLAYDRGNVTVHCADGLISPTTDTNRCGDNLFWSLENGILTISGTGDMWNYDTYQNSSSYLLSTAPWYPQRDMITQIRLSEGVAGIGNYAFGTSAVLAPYSTSCKNLAAVDLPETLQRIGAYGFAYCTALKEIRFLGDAPAIGGAAFYGLTATAYYPQNNPTWTESVRSGYNGTITWEPYLPTESTLSLGDATACAGRGFTVELTLDENPGIMGLSFQLDYDSSVMEFEGAEDGVLTGWTVNVKKNILVWDGDREHTDTGCLLKLKFRLKEDAAPGETRIGIINFKAVNFDESSLFFRFRSAQVTVLVHRPGDANGDGKVDIADLVRLRKYLVGVEKKIIAGNADVNADEVVDILDLVRLRKYIAQVDGVILE